MIESLPIQIAPIQGDGFHAFIEVVIARKKLKMLIDTGASRTVFDETQLSKLISSEKFESIEQLSAGLGTTSAPGKSTIIPAMRLGNVKLRNYEAVILDLSHVNALYSTIGLPEIVGVLGSDIMLKYRTVIDFGSNLLILKTTKRD